MRLAVDMQGALTDGSRRRGIGRYTNELVKAMAHARGGHDMRLLLNARHGEAAGEVARTFAPRLGHNGLSFYRSPAHPKAPVLPTAPTRRMADSILRRHLAGWQPDAVLFSSLFEFAQEDVTPIDLSRYPARLSVAILYDLIPLRFPELYLADPGAKAAFMAGVETLRSADLLLTISEASRADAVNLAGLDPERIVNISAAADPHFRRLDLREEERQGCARRLGLSRPFVTYIAGADPRKNLQGALSIFANLPPAVRRAHQLLLVTRLPAAEQAAMQRAARELGVEADGLVIACGVGDDELVRLLNMARALLFPSLYEGFGLPVLEAMQCGTPVLVAGHSSLPEIVDRPDILFQPDNVPGAAAKLARILLDDDRQAELSAWGRARAECFTWERTAHLAWGAISSHLSEEGRAHPHVMPAVLLELDGARHELAGILAGPAEGSPGAPDVVDDLLFSVPCFHEGASRRLLIDATMTAAADLHTGIQRVVRRLCAAFQDMPMQQGVVPLPVSLRPGQILALPGFGQPGMPQGAAYPVDIRPGDDLLMLDSTWEAYPHLGDLFQRISRHGGRIITCVYDLIPELHPHVCAEGMVEIHARWLAEAVARSHVLLCISRAVADELAAYIRRHGLARRPGQSITWFHCGADILPPRQPAPPSRQVTDIFSAGRPVALMVGTLEPRKGQAVALEAFERLWAEGQDMALCIVGAAGWDVDELKSRLCHHPEARRRLHWLDRAGDDDLAYAYAHAEVVLCCSTAEGFGLPIVEAARQGCRVVCSDIPVFREVAGRAATYFRPGDAAALAEILSARRYRAVPGAHAVLQPLSWQQSAEQIHARLYGAGSEEAGPVTEAMLAAG